MSTSVLIKANRAKTFSVLDNLFDVIFIGSILHMGGRLLERQDGWSFVDVFAHWLPLYYTWILLEGFVNRFNHIRWIPVLYFWAGVAIVCSAFTFEPCRLDSLNSQDVPYGCAGFSLSIYFGRLIMCVAWVTPALIGYGGGERYLIWKGVASSVPGTFYLLCFFFDSNYVVLPVLWFFAMGLDVTLNFAPSSFAWEDREWPRHCSSSEERHGMLVAIVLAEMVIVAIVPLNTGITYINSVVSMLFFIMAFTLALWTFVVCDTALSLDLSGGRHGLRRGWALKALWLVCQFGSLTLLLLMGFVGKTVGTQLSPFERRTFGLSLGFVVFLSMLSQATHEPGTVGKTFLPRSLRFLIRCACSVTLIGVAFVPVDSLNDGSWLGVVTTVLVLSMSLEWIGRYKNNNIAQIFSFVYKK